VKWKKGSEGLEKAKGGPLVEEGASYPEEAFMEARCLS
jgi:hypothetical protein